MKVTANGIEARGTNVFRVDSLKSFPYDLLSAISTHEASTAALVIREKVFRFQAAFACAAESLLPLNMRELS